MGLALALPKSYKFPRSPLTSDIDLISPHNTGPFCHFTEKDGQEKQLTLPVLDFLVHAVAPADQISLDRPILLNPTLAPSCVSESTSEGSYRLQ